MMLHTLGSSILPHSFAEEETPSSNYFLWKWEKGHAPSRSSFPSCSEVAVVPRRFPADPVPLPCLQGMSGPHLKPSGRGSNYLLTRAQKHPGVLLPLPGGSSAHTLSPRQREWERGFNMATDCLVRRASPGKQPCAPGAHLSLV